MNKKSIKSLYVLLILLLSAPTLSAQEAAKQWEYDLRLGLNIGGTTPLPLPAEIRKINSFTSGLNPVAGVRATRWFESHPQWGVTSGITVDYRGMKESADVKYWYTHLVVGEGENAGTFSGTFTGKNRTTVRNGYLTVPLLATYRPFKHWTFHLGGYFSWMLSADFSGTASDGYIREGGPTGDRIEVKNASFDFSDNLRKIDAGISVGADWRFNKRMSVTGDLTWGLVPVFPSDFKGICYKMYNIYFALGLSYRLL